MRVFLLEEIASPDLMFTNSIYRIYQWVPDLILGPPEGE